MNPKSPHQPGSIPVLQPPFPYAQAIIDAHAIDMILLIRSAGANDEFVAMAPERVWIRVARLPRGKLKTDTQQ